MEEVLGWCGRCEEALGDSDPQNPHHRWSGGDGTFLPRICPRCRQSYDPLRPETFDAASRRGRRTPSRRVLLGLLTAGWVLGGRIVLATAAAGFADGSAMGGGSVSGSGGAVLVVVLAVFVFLPWCFGAVVGCLLCLLDRVEVLPAKLLAGFLSGLLVCVGLPAAVLLAGALLGPLAGLSVRWWELRDAS